MTGEQLRQLENQLWTAADQLRANSKSTATEYSFPVLGLIFLQHTYNRFINAKIEIEKITKEYLTKILISKICNKLNNKCQN